MRKSFVAAALAAFLGWAGTATAQNYPNRPITLVIPFAAGGPTDVLGRTMAQRMGEILGQTIVVENVGGAGGMLGSSRVAKAAPDGYTFLLGTVGTHAQNQTLYKKPLYHAADDFTPVGLIAELPLLLIANKKLPADDMKSFVAYAKQNEGKMQYGSAGAGSATHLGCVLVNQVLGTNITHVPYPGTGPAMTDLIGGRVDFLCDIITTAKPQIDGGTVKPLATLSKTRSPALPNVPTAVEQGTDIEAYTWNAFFLPKNTPADVVKKLNATMIEAMKAPNVRARLEGLGAVFVSEDRTTPEYLGKFVRSEIEKWEKPIKAAGVSADWGLKFR
jgi:tripartite-type tricarboxylate transporter receptor subunit TctC